MKKIRLLIVLIATVSLFACAKKQELSIIFVGKTMDPSIQFWTSMQQGMQSACKEYQVNFQVIAPVKESDIERQKELMAYAIEQKPDAIILAAAHYHELNELCEQAIEKSIKVITIDSDISENSKSAFIGTDNIEAGKQLAKAMQGVVSDDAQIAVISFVRDTRTAMEREEGFIDALSEQQRKNLIGVFYCDTNTQAAMDKTLSIIENYPNIDCVAGLNETSASGAVLALKHLEKQGKIAVVGIDSSLVEIEAIEDQSMALMIVQKPFNMGYIAIKTAVEAIEGKSIENVINTDTEIITKQNMYSKEHQKLLFIFE